ncbi:hypothetical protein K505DRAFT_29404 [Melanomma pulvis-pyrius CBS 109.77]|uniref:Uncharacterized protein n=1 Tax=Melanomma pulvis-pyrius CBS 109.77 TaxID=1314802 RepID=A0A6A6XU54_9PLEO|nr:hypothetical protein K505DRAFT_29404 [Melanomma pulvis-pyrius CBS 109.77]
MARDLPIVPALPLARPNSENSSQPSSPPRRLSPGALKSEPGQSTSATLCTVATDFIPIESGSGIATRTTFEDTTDAVADKMETLDFAEVESPTVRDLTDPASTAVGEGVQFFSESDTFVLTCNTQDLLKSSKGQDIVAKLVDAKNIPRNVQLNIFTGPRFQHIHTASQWLIETMGPYMGTVQHVQVVIIRRGEYVSGNWVVPKIDLETFKPLKYFIANFIHILPKHVDIIWGASEDHALLLRKHYLTRAVPGEQAAFEKELDKGVTSYSESISSATLKSISSEYLHLQGSYSHTSILNPNAVAFIPGMNPEAKPFVPAPVYNRPTPLYVPTTGHAAGRPVDPRDTWGDGPQHGMSAMYEIDENVVHYGPPVNEMGPPVNQMDMNMNFMYGDPEQMSMHMPAYPHSPAYAMNPNPPPSYSGYPQPMVPFGGAPVYATAPQYAQQQQAQGKRARKRGNKDSGRPRRGQDLNQNPSYDYYQSQSRQPGPFIDNNYGYSRKNSRNDYGSGAATSSAAGGADNRGPKKSKRKSSHKTKYQQNAYPERGNHGGQGTNAESGRSYFPAPQVNNPAGADLPQMIANGGFDPAKVNAGEEYKGMPIQPQGHNHGQTNHRTCDQALSEYQAVGKVGKHVVAWLVGKYRSDYMVRDVHEEKSGVLPYADKVTAW